ncbi:hypothetical protein Franean1_0274 [Parafrankia sp. EAN1pec]|uniref:hypothetical protein n=1 Tax=Parafrankia sp. (strain EAN1pec) TaxID=298653 RepID=UPI000054227C|nr:hypothetical protein Franean1_0274 [Frankia sp. EAN1pec]
MPTVATPADEPARPGDLIDIAGVRALLGVGKARAYQLSRDKSWPDPWLDHPQLRLWLRADVEAWLDRHRPGWRDEH